MIYDKLKLDLVFSDYSVTLDGKIIGLIFKRKNEPWVARTRNGVRTYRNESRDKVVEWLVNIQEQNN